MDLIRNAPAKPLRGTSLLRSRGRTAERKAHEQREMRAAKRRDGGKCRWPHCRHGNLPVDVCHETHRGSGGNPKGDRTTRDQLIAFCRMHHGLWDTHEIDARPQTARGFDGPVDFYCRTESGRMEIVASERSVGVSVMRDER